MKHFVFIVLFLLAFMAKAGESMISELTKGNVYFVGLIHPYYKGGFEINRKQHMLVEMVQKMLEVQGYEDNININFHPNLWKDTVIYSVGYGNYPYLQHEPGSIYIHGVGNRFTKGLQFMIRDRDINVEYILRLVSAACNDVEFIKANQRVIAYQARRGSDTVISVPGDIVKTYLQHSSSVVDQVLGMRFFRAKGKHEKDRTDYYFQNGKYHFYDTREPEKEWSAKQQKYITTKTFGQDILVVDNVLEIAGEDEYNEPFIFINDSEFFFLNGYDSAVGPFTIDNIMTNRYPVYEISYEDGRYKLYFNDYGREPYKQTVLFIPDSNFIVSNYNLLENKFIEEVIREHQIKPVASKKLSGKLLLVIIAGCLLVFTGTGLALDRKA